MISGVDESNSDSEYTGSIKPYMFEPVESNVDNATAVKTPPKVGQASQVVSEVKDRRFEAASKW